MIDGYHSKMHTVLMPRSLWRLIAFIFFLLATHVACERQSEIPTTVILVRHAEKAAVAGDDPPLSDVGVKRAQLLAGVVGDAGIQIVYCSQFRRTRETAEPLLALTVARLNTVAVPFDDVRGYAANIRRDITENHSGKTILIVNHSNTVPALVEALGGKSVSPIRDDEYDNLFILTIPSDATAPTRIVKARYTL